MSKKLIKKVKRQLRDVDDKVRDKRYKRLLKNLPIVQDFLNEAKITDFSYNNVISVATMYHEILLEVIQNYEEELMKTRLFHTSKLATLENMLHMIDPKY